jgi:hypothetical protein
MNFEGAKDVSVLLPAGSTVYLPAEQFGQLCAEMDADARGVPFTKSPWAERIIIGEVHFLKKEK